MPAYLYHNEAGEIEEFVFSISDFLDNETFTDDEGVVWTYDFGATVANQVRGAQTHYSARSRRGEIIDTVGFAVHPNQVNEYNRVASAVGLGTRWDKRGACCIPDKHEQRKLGAAMHKAKERAGDKDFDGRKAYGL